MVHSGVFSLTVFWGIELETLEPLRWLILWRWTRAWQHWRKYSYPGPIHIYKPYVFWALYGCPRWKWVLCGLLVLQLVVINTVIFLTVWALVVEAIQASMKCQCASNRKMEIVHILCCYDNNYLTTILSHFACVRIWCYVSVISCWASGPDLTSVAEAYGVWNLATNYHGAYFLSFYRPAPVGTVVSRTCARLCRTDFVLHK